MGTRILVVDDEPAIRYSMVYMLRKVGYEVYEARDGAQALNRIEHALEEGEPYDLLLTDLQMPKLNGAELIFELKSQEIFLPTLVVSASTDQRLISAYLNDGCTDFLMKPFEGGELIERIEALLQEGAEEKRRMLCSPASS